MSVHEIGWHKTRSISHCHQKMRSILLDRQLHGRHNWTILNQLSQSKSKMCVHLPQSRIERAVHSTTHRTSKRIYTSINIHIEVCMLKSGNSGTPTPIQTHTHTHIDDVSEVELRTHIWFVVGTRYRSAATSHQQPATTKAYAPERVTPFVVGWVILCSNVACSFQVSKEQWFVPFDGVGMDVWVSEWVTILLCYARFCFLNSVFCVS